MLNAVVWDSVATVVGVVGLAATVSVLGVGATVVVVATGHSMAGMVLVGCVVGCCTAVGNVVIGRAGGLLIMFAFAFPLRAPLSPRLLGGCLRKNVSELDGIL